MRVIPSFIIGIVLTCGIARLSHAQEWSPEPAQDRGVGFDAGAASDGGPDPLDAGADSAPCIVRRCDDETGPCEEPEDGGVFCDEGDSIYERPVVDPPRDSDITGCGCSWYQLSNVSFGLLGLCLALGGLRRFRRIRS